MSIASILGLRSKKKTAKKLIEINIRFCPKCNGKEIDMVAGGQIGLWRCSDCGFQSPIFPEKKIKLNETKNIKK